MEEDQLAQFKVLSQTAVMSCDLCGLPRSHTEIVVVHGRGGFDDLIEQLRLCPSCRRLMEADELPLGVGADEIDDGPEE
jgi:hypothetical protein